MYFFFNYSFRMRESLFYIYMYEVKNYKLMLLLYLLGMVISYICLVMLCQCCLVHVWNDYVMHLFGMVMSCTCLEWLDYSLLDMFRHVSTMVASLCLHIFDAFVSSILSGCCGYVLFLLLLLLFHCHPCVNRQNKNICRECFLIHRSLLDCLHSSVTCRFKLYVVRFLKIILFYF